MQTTFRYDMSIGWVVDEIIPSPTSSWADTVRRSVEQLAEQAKVRDAKHSQTVEIIDEPRTSDRDRMIALVRAERTKANKKWSAK
jgi:hypothetical protein